MDLEQMIKRLEWLDDERRKDKMVIATLEERLAHIEAGVAPLSKQIAEVNTEVTRVASSLARFDQIDAALVQIRVESSRAVEAIEKTRAEREREAEKARRVDIEILNKSVAEVRKGLDPIPDLKKSLQTRTEEDFRLGRLIEELEQKLYESTRVDEEYRRSNRLLDEGRRQDTKRLTDLAGEVSALRKRVDEQRGKIDISVDAVRKLDLRMNELAAADIERRQAQVVFIDKQNMQLVERERIWKEWQVRFEDITKEAGGLDATLQSVDATQRSVKRAQEAFEEITQRFERRLNEITEMQRLVEERFRQEWITFKADDQKRWTNYTLAQEEQQREFNRAFEKYNARLVVLEDISQELRDTLHQIIEDSQKRLQVLLSAMHQVVEEHDRTFGR